MGCGDGGCEIVDDGGIGDTQGDAFRWNRESKQVVLEFGVLIADSVSRDARTACRDGLTVAFHSGWLDGEDEVEKAAERVSSRRKWSAAARRVV
jgi:hypothetical protein